LKHWICNQIIYSNHQKTKTAILLLAILLSAATVIGQDAAINEDGADHVHKPEPGNRKTEDGNRKTETGE